VLAAGKHTIVFDFQPDEPGFGKGSTGVLRETWLLLKSGSTKIYDFERGAASTLSTRYFASAMASVSDCAVALEQ
jgi:hypothetical protein